ncbi:hypothetical protein P4571_15270 [Niallia alba]|uniref:hypothetical protein n=1 Tax=Niallia alba TaxID=2729105 RepID=UPI002E2520B8|nr:hypothetical protein [Niallia alba]
MSRRYFIVVNIFFICLLSVSALFLIIMNYNRDNQLELENRINIMEYKKFATKESYGYNWTGAINKAFNQLRKDGGGELYLPYGVYYISNIIVPSNVVLHLQSAGIYYGSKEKQPSCFKRIPGSVGYAITFNSSSKSKDVILEGEGIGDGVRTKDHVIIDGLFVFRTGGIGISFGAVNTITNVQSAYNVKNGIEITKSDSVITQFYSYGNHQNGMYIGEGIANTSISNGKLEWNDNSNLSLYNTNNIYISNVNIDRANKYGISINGTVKVFFNNIRLWRNYKSEQDNKYSSHILVEGNNHKIYMNNVSMESGVNDDGKGILSPKYAVNGWGSKNSKIFVTNLDAEEGYLESFFSPYSGDSIQLLQSTNSIK